MQSSFTLDSQTVWRSIRVESSSLFTVLASSHGGDLKCVLFQVFGLRQGVFIFCQSPMANYASFFLCLVIDKRRGDPLVNNSRETSIRERKKGECCCCLLLEQVQRLDHLGDRLLETLEQRSCLALATHCVWPFKQLHHFYLKISFSGFGIKNSNFSLENTNRGHYSTL